MSPSQAGENKWTKVPRGNGRPGRAEFSADVVLHEPLIRVHVDALVLPVSLTGDRYAFVEPSVHLFDCI